MANAELENIKQEFIGITEKRVEDKIMEQSTADLIIKLIRNAETKEEAMKISALGTVNKRTGFHFDLRLEKQNGMIKYFKKNEELSFSDGSNKPVNKLIIGDNYDALNNLLIEYRGKIDVIYIDPPYGADSMGEFAETNYTNNIIYTYFSDITSSSQSQTIILCGKIFYFIVSELYPNII